MPFRIPEFAGHYAARRRGQFNRSVQRNRLCPELDCLLPRCGCVISNDRKVLEAEIRGGGAAWVLASRLVEAIEGHPRAAEAKWHALAATAHPEDVQLGPWNRRGGLNGESKPFIETSEAFRMLRRQCEPEYTRDTRAHGRTHPRTLV